jgi:hypothetical protein
MSSCPAGFQIGTAADLCRMVCPPGFKYLNNAGVEKCVYNPDNQYTLHLQQFPMNSNPGTFDAEKTRFTDDYAALFDRIQSDQAAAAQTDAAESTGTVLVAAHDAATTNAGLLDAMDRTIAALKPKRPPTQPQEDVNASVSQIFKDQTSTDLLVIQVAFFTVFLCLLSFVFLPVVLAQYAVVLLLSAGIAIGYYLWTI